MGVLVGSGMLAWGQAGSSESTYAAEAEGSATIFGFERNRARHQALENARRALLERRLEQLIPPVARAENRRWLRESVLAYSAEFLVDEEVLAESEDLSAKRYLLRLRAHLREELLRERLEAMSIPLRAGPAALRIAMLAIAQPVLARSANTSAPPGEAFGSPLHLLAQRALEQALQERGYIIARAPQIPSSFTGTAETPLAYTLLAQQAGLDGIFRWQVRLDEKRPASAWIGRVAATLEIHVYPTALAPPLGQAPALPSSDLAPPPAARFQAGVEPIFWSQGVRLMHLDAPMHAWNSARESVVRIAAQEAAERLETHFAPYAREDPLGQRYRVLFTGFPPQKQDQIVEVLETMGVFTRLEPEASNPNGFLLRVVSPDHGMRMRLLLRAALLREHLKARLEVRAGRFLIVHYSGS